MSTLRETLEALQSAVDKGESLPPDLLDKAKRLHQRHEGDVVGLLVTMLDENFRGRARNRDLEAKLPKEGAVVLSAEEAAKWEALKGFDPKDVTTKLAERDKFEGDLKKASREKTLTTAATIAKLNPKVLARLPGVDELEFEVVGEGDKQVAMVKGADGKAVPLPDYAKTQWAEFAPALNAQQDAPATNGAAWIPQPTGGSQGQPTNLVTQTLEANKARATAPNALTAKKG
jgi:hypothetical protein